MLQSNYNVKSEDPMAKLKKKLLAKPENDDMEAPTTKEIDADISGNRPALSKEEVDRYNAYKDKSNSQITGGNYDVPDTSNFLKKNTLNDNNENTTDEISTGRKIGDGAMAGAGGIMDIAITAAANKGPMTKKENTANTINLAMKGMSTGSKIGTAVGGPYGAAIGAGVGLVAGAATGLLQSRGDKKELEEKAKLERITEINNIKDSREQAQKLSEGKEIIKKQKNMLQQQMGILSSNYSTSKN